MKMDGIKIGDRFKLTIDGKRVTPDEAKRLAKLSKNKQIPARKPKTRPARPGEVSNVSR
ncbi:MAG TPA: hypothetical protein VFU31_07850 [Candidatus Binatia bacterium]|nr:hypothetical protein [Candidatus Binatia bacterium]